MKQKNKPYNLLLCLLYGMLISLLPSLAYAQSSVPAGGDAVLNEGGLEVVNSIVWGNVTASALPATGNNLVNKDPLFSSATVFSLRTESPAVGKGDNSAWEALGLTPAVDIAGAPHAARMNIGAFENNTLAIITFAPISNGTFMVYADNKLISDGTELPVGTEIVVTVLADAGYKVGEIHAGEVAVTNGGSFYLPGSITLSADITVGRPGQYPTLAEGAFEVYNSIIYDNVDMYGNYEIDATNLAGKPDFTSATQFSLLPKSVALGIGKGEHIPAAVTKDIAGSPIDRSSVNAGAYQNSEFTVSRTIQGGGSLKIFHIAQNEAEESIETEITADAPGTLYGPGTIRVEAYPATGCVLKSLKANGDWLNPADENKDPYAGFMQTEGRFILAMHSTIEVEFIAADADKQRAAVSLTEAGVVFANNIVYGNVGFASNRNEDTANLTEDPSFELVTDYRLQPSSVAINAGDNAAITAYASYLTLFGQPRILGDVVDMGAYETGEIAYTVSYTSTIIRGDKTVARLELFDADGNAIPTGNSLAPESVIEVKVTILDANFEQLGRICLNGKEYIDGTQFTLKENTKVTANIQEKPQFVYYSSPGGSLLVYSGNDPVANGAKAGLGTLLSVQAIPSAGNTLDFIAINGKHIAGAEANTGYITSVRGETTILAASVDMAEKAADGGKGLILWDALNATILVTDKNSGSEVALGSLLAPGTELHVEITPPAGDEYKLVFMELNGESYPSLSFDVTIPAAIAGEVATTFIAVRYETDTTQDPPIITPGTFFAVTTGITGNGTLTLTDADAAEVLSGQEVESGSELTVVAVAADGYRLTSLTLNDEPILSGDKVLITEASLVMAVFEQIEDPLTPPDPLTQSEIRVTVIGDGTIRLADAADNAVEPGDWVTKGTEIFVTATAEAGYELTSLTVNGMDIAPDASFLANSDVEVKAVFDRLPDVTEPTYAVITGVTGEGTLTLLIDGTTAIQSGEMIPAGSNLTIQATAADGYLLNNITLNGLTVLNGHSFTLQKETAVMAVFNQDPLPTPQPATHKEVVITVVGYGELSLTDDQLAPIASGDQVANNTEITVTATAAEGYTLTALTVNGTPLTTGDSFTLTVKSEVKAVFEREPDVTGGTYMVTTGVMGEGKLVLKNGSTTVESGQKVAAGTVLTVQPTASAGYALSDVTVNGVSMLPGTAFTVRKETNVIAIFDQDPLPIPQPATHKEVLLTVMGYGTVSLKDDANAEIQSGDWVLDGTAIRVTATAADGYKLGTITVNGAPHTNGQSFTLAENTEVIVNFDRKPDAPVTPPVVPPVPEITYVTLEIPNTLPAGMTIDPAPGRYQIERGSNQVLRITADSRYDDKYVFLQIDDQYVMLKGSNGSYSYTLVNITKDVRIAVIVSDTPDPNPDPSGTDDIAGGSRIWSEGNQVCILTDAPANVRIVTIAGRLVANQKVSAGETRIQLPYGVYVVALSDGTVAKIAVRVY